MHKTTNSGLDISIATEISVISLYSFHAVRDNDESQSFESRRELLGFKSQPQLRNIHILLSDFLRNMSLEYESRSLPASLISTMPLLCYGLEIFKPNR